MFGSQWKKRYGELAARMQKLSDNTNQRMDAMCDAIYSSSRLELYETRNKTQEAVALYEKLERDIAFLQENLVIKVGSPARLYRNGRRYNQSLFGRGYEEVVRRGYVEITPDNHIRRVNFFDDNNDFHGNVVVFDVPLNVPNVIDDEIILSALEDMMKFARL